MMTVEQHAPAQTSGTKARRPAPANQPSYYRWYLGMVLALLVGTVLVMV